MSDDLYPTYPRKPVSEHEKRETKTQEVLGDLTRAYNERDDTLFEAALERVRLLIFPLSLLLLVVLAAPAAAQRFYIYDGHGNVFENINCTPGRQILTAPKSTSELQALYKQIATNDALLGQALRSPVPEYRFTGVFAIATRKLPKQSDLIERLADEHPTVRLAARQALVILAKKYGQTVDLGPLPGASQPQIVEAQDEWRKWFDARRDAIPRIKS